MKLIKIKIINFGQFSNFAFDLADENLNVFFGANEAGKSTVVAFIKQILFGFHLGKRTSDFFEDYKPLARVSPMGGSLFFTAENGQQFEVERLYASGKGSKLGTLTVKCDGQVVPESVFFDQIKNIDGDFYAASFIFNQDMLAKVIDISQTDLLERIYYLGAASSDQLIDLRDKFAKAADKLFKSRGSLPPVNKLLTKMQEQRTQLDETEGEFTDYQVLESSALEQKNSQKNSEAELHKLQSELNQIEQLRKQLPNYQKLQELKQQLKEVKFDPEQYQLAQKLAVQQQNLQQTISGLRKRLTQFTDIAENARAAKLVQKKPELLQWKAEYASCVQKAQQIMQAEQQLLALTPDLQQIIGFDQEVIIKLQQDYQALPSKQPVVQSDNPNNRIWLVAAGVLALIGVILLVTGPQLVGGLLLVLGIIGAGWAVKQQKVQENRQAAVHAKQAKVKQLQTAFSQKYHLNPETLDLPNLLNQWRQYQLQKQNEQANREQLADLQEQVDQLARELSMVLNHNVPTDFAGVIAALDALAEQEQQKQHQEEAKATVESNLAENNAELQQVNLKLKAALAEAGVKTLADYEQLQIVKQQQETIKTQIAALTANLQDDLPQLAQFLQDGPKVQAKETALRQKIAAAEEQNHALQGQVAETNVKMANLASSTAVFTAKQELANTQTLFRNQSAEYLANLFASKWISRALDLASNERFPKMLTDAKEYLRLLTNNRYNDIKIDKKLSVTRADGKTIKVKYLSRGTQEQLYFALKLAFVQQVKDQINLPILIDDSFVNFDDQRTGQIEQLLKQIAQTTQVLIFTAQTKLVEQLKLQPLTFTKGTENV
ncbi:AAA family ATPase [Lactobacillus sp. ESL0731]|uniref:AAA family ATPase n=1 Tax=unclassified Lactobacillus TaxID=2620435 RepID=UPI0023F64EA6|nr:MULTISPECIES: AAA family ATPase [unclassified Lactobacillus]WEV50581.1 AAA family ATPase [Lactobacillus sp. ESL0700]WEV61711.1 AAA family ATPase [Lactobacillus sp. ESL0731]